MTLLVQRILFSVLLLRVASGLASSSFSRLDPSRVVQLSWRPRAFLYKGFLSEVECDHLVALAREGGLEKSMVLDDDTGKSVMSDVRTSSGMFLEKMQDEVVARIEQRIAAWTLLPQENGEEMQILHYENGEKYEPHFDILLGKHEPRGGLRIATVLMYLSSVKMGGETVFPDADGKLLQPKDDTWSECAKRGYAVKPVKGDAVVFFSLHPNATADGYSLHGSCPVMEGEKWSATKWIHVSSFDDRVVPAAAAAAGCEDENVLCSEWAAHGECAKNPGYMVGDEESPGFCRKSCNVCSSNTV